MLLPGGTLRVSLRVTCQRCLEGMDLQIEASPWLLLLRPEEGQDRLDDEADILVTDKPLSLSALVEDELLLALPMVPTHELSECPTKVYARKEMGGGRHEADGEKKNPFAVLDRLKKTK